MVEDHNLASDFSNQRALAEAHLWAEMEAAGLHRAQGWRIVEFTRDTPEGTEWVLRPMHFSRVAPAHLECVVKLSVATASVKTTCKPELQHRVPPTLAR